MAGQTPTSEHSSSSRIKVSSPLHGQNPRDDTGRSRPLATRKSTHGHKTDNGHAQQRRPSTKLDSGTSPHAVALETMRQRMSDALAQKQLKKSGNTPPIDLAKAKLASPMMEDSVEESSPPSTSLFSAISGTISTDSAKTVRATPLETPGALRTPSYPFPRMQFRLNRGISQRSGPHHRPFTLLSPTSEPSVVVPVDPSPRQHTSSELSTPIGNDPSTQLLPDHPNYPTPDLYDMVLMLSTEPGLDSWWANVTEILAEAYGAERASLARPADMTDLENVPWGQRATFNIYGSDSGDSFTLDSNLASDADVRSFLGAQEHLMPATRSPTAPQRPTLISRHSIAGPLPERFHRTPDTRPGGPTRSISYVNPDREVATSDYARPRPAQLSSIPQTLPMQEDGQSTREPRDEPPMSSISSPRCHVWRALQPLEAEPDALLVRTGVASLFGKRKPVILTRAYSEEHSSPSGTPSDGHSSADDSEGRRGKRTARASINDTEHSFGGKSIRAFDEFEQPEPSPWSQSPSPSPAARPDPEESPFFAPSTAAMVDEAAFEQDPPVHDYGATANQSLSAIGVDMSKTLVHIPLIQPVPSKSVIASGLRFPVAILSFLSPLNPYPRNLRHSLENLLPHLAGTFSLAQQFSTLQDRLRGGTSRRSAAFGLGGTFSDEGSELELVSELSSQLLEKEPHRISSLHGSHYSPSEGTAASKSSFAGSVVGTPLLDHLGLNSSIAATPGRSGSEMVDSYFSAKRNRSSHLVQTPGKVGKDEGSEKSRRGDKATRPRGSSKRSATSGKGHADIQNLTSHRLPSLTSESDHGDQTGSSPPGSVEPIASRPMHRDSVVRVDNEKPLPELISSLMLNAVPLQLFLAKPTTGDLVWTNRKFDAFRSQGEGRVRDPWKNVHESDRDSLASSWNEALNSGSQFTHYVRVKRFNSDSDFRWFVFRASTLLSSSGRLLYWIGSFLDVHEQYMKNLQASEKEASMARDAKIRALADAIPQILFEAIEGEGIVSVNQQWHTFSGQSLDEARGLGFARQVHREDLYKCGVLTPSESKTQHVRAASDATLSTNSSSNKSAQQALSRSIFTPDNHSLERMLNQGALVAETDENGRTSYSTEIRLRSKGGEFRWHLVRLVKVQDELLNNNRASWYGTCTDIEVRMTLERDLNQANRKVNEEMESKTKFFANMSHEIRTPLNGILGSMPWLVESQLDHDQRRTVDTIQNSANNLRELVDNILDVSKVEAGKMTLLPKWFHVRSLCEEVVDTVSFRAIERGLELNYSLHSDVPSTLKGDPFRIRQILLNLMGNAVKFTQQGEVYLRCYLGQGSPSSAGGPRTLLAFDVVDTGRGFNETEFQRLFKQFGQIEGANQHETGSGLGLFLSKQLVEMHGGALSVQSKAGEGSTFSFFVTVEVASPGSDSSQAAVHDRPAPPQATRTSSNKTPTIAASKSIVHTPGLSKYSSHEAQFSAPASSVMASPPLISPTGSILSARSNSGNIIFGSSISSMVPTPDSTPGLGKATANPREHQYSFSEQAPIILPGLQRVKSNNETDELTLESARPNVYSIVVICPADHARSAIKQHIEHVVPHQIPAHVTTLKDVGAFLDLMKGPASPSFSHIVLDTPASSDIMLFMRHMQDYKANVIPALVIVTDHYQKRDIQDDFATLTASGRKAFLIHKPIKPSVFAMIFDPAQLRQLSKDRAREVVQTGSDDFKKIANRVKDSIGNKSFRILLVEDSDVNRMVINRYLKRVGLISDEAKDGQECVDKVTTQPYGYYSLIICDIQMPRKNGYQACTEIRQWERSLGSGQRPVPIMALTANAMPEERAAAASAGFSDYLTKPVDFNRLGTMMMTLMDVKTPHMLLRDMPTDEGPPSGG